MKTRQLERELKLKKEFTYDLRTLFGLRNSSTCATLETEQAKKSLVTPSGGKRIDSN